MGTSTMLTVLLLAPVLLPIAAAVGYLIAGWNRATAWLSAAVAILLLATTIVLAVAVGSTGPLAAAGGLVRADSLSVFMLLVIDVVALVATAGTPAYLRGELAAGRASLRTAARHSVLVQLFLAMMALAVLAANIGLTWVAVEATTVVTAFLVGQRHTRAAVEAAWKYVVICSTGIALALLGTLLLNYASLHSGSGAGLGWAQLVHAAADLDPATTQLAVVLLVIGFGTKAGLAPLHAWLPDAHSQAPAPVSALMSGVLLAVAFSAILRVKAIADAALGDGFVRGILIAVALVSLVVAATLLLGQRDYKRMLAYSSIEHMGLLALGAAAGTRLAIAAVLLHMLGHGLAKSSLFLTAGHVLQAAGTSLITGVRALLGRAPALAACLGAGVVALVGFPPFSVFASELALVRAGVAAGLAWPITIGFLLVVVIAAALLWHTSQMLLGTPAGAPETTPAPAAARNPHPLTGRWGGDAATLPAAAALLVCAVLGISLGPLAQLIDAAAAVVATGAPR